MDIPASAEIYWDGFSADVDDIEFVLYTTIQLEFSQICGEIQGALGSK
jgi:hypothetical protein